MLRLRPYKPCDARNITEWFRDEHSFRQWSADRYQSFPITPDDMNSQYDAERENPLYFPMTAFDETGVVGHLIMRFPGPDLTCVRFGFVAVDAAKRGKGLGKEMLRLAIRYAFDCLKVDRITLGVFENNPAAVGCYRSVGFSERTDVPKSFFTCMGEQWRCIEMECKR